MACQHIKPVKGVLERLCWSFFLILFSAVCMPSLAFGTSWKSHLTFIDTAPACHSTFYSDLQFSGKDCSDFLYCCLVGRTTSFMAGIASLWEDSSKSSSNFSASDQSGKNVSGQVIRPNALGNKEVGIDSSVNKEKVSEKEISPESAANQSTLAAEVEKKQVEPVVETGKNQTGQSDTQGKTSQAGNKSGQPGGVASAKTVRLFGYVEFRGPLKNIPKWQRVLGEELPALTFEGYQTKNMPPAVADRWNKLAAGLKDAPLKEKVQKVNIFFNQWPYKTDMSVWGVEDYWATPKEFIKKSGDCEDYAITKYFALRSLGVPVNQMRILAVRERIRGIGHAVLVVFMDDSAYILDNMTNLVLPHTRLTNYEPKFSVNEEYRWAYVKPIAKTK